MRFITSPLFPVLAVLTMLAVAETQNSARANPEEYPIVLDPVCKTPEMRNPPLAPGNPAQSTRKMAQRLEAILQNTPPDALPYLNARVASTLQGKFFNLTQLNDKLQLYIKLGIEQTKAGRPDF